MVTTAQATALKADIALDPGLSLLPQNSDSAQVVADAYNQLAVPSFWVWRTTVGNKEIYETVSVDGTTWSWPNYISRSVAERDAWRELFAVTGHINAALANTRQGVADIFSGTAGVAQRTHLLAIGRRTATRAEKLFATGTGTTVAPAVMGFEGSLGLSDVMQAWVT